MGVRPQFREEFIYLGLESILGITCSIKIKFGTVKTNELRSNNVTFISNESSKDDGKVIDAYDEDLESPDPEIVKRAVKRMEEAAKREKERIEAHFKLIVDKAELDKFLAIAKHEAVKTNVEAAHIFKGKKQWD